MLEEYYGLFIILMIGYLSAQLSLFFKVPAGRLVGPILAIGLLKIIGLDIIIPSYIKSLFAVVLGIYLGVRFDKELVNRLKKLVRPSLLLIIWYIASTSLNGYLLSHLAVIDNVTAFLSVVPGGIAETTVLAMSYHADLLQITCFQMARLLSVVLVLPLLIKKCISTDEMETGKSRSEKTNKSEKKILNWLGLLIFGGLGGLVFNALHFPAGNMIGALITIVFLNAKFDYKLKAPPKFFYHLAQIGMGGIIGTSFTSEGLFYIADLFIPILVMTLLVILSSLILAYCLGKIFKWNFITSFLAAVPGGLIPMIILADEVNADRTVVGTLQMVRLLTAIVIIPFTYSVFIELF
ncbi:MAG: uncharacterized protein PWQ96_2437 [Clostridia bacterium]|nr:hypothetical protein [Clostridiales bacterium]MDK2986793.1 uncharacterized protein [Clostridia bacterium]